MTGIPKLGQGNKTEAAIRAQLEANPKGVTAPKIAKAVGVSTITTRAWLKAMKSAGELETVKDNESPARAYLYAKNLPEALDARAPKARGYRWPATSVYTEPPRLIRSVWDMA